MIVVGQTIRNATQMNIRTGRVVAQGIQEMLSRGMIFVGQVSVSTMHRYNGARIRSANGGGLTLKSVKYGTACATNVSTSERMRMGNRVVSMGGSQNIKDRVLNLSTNVVRTTNEDVQNTIAMRVTGAVYAIIMMIVMVSLFVNVVTLAIGLMRMAIVNRGEMMREEISGKLFRCTSGEFRLVAMKMVYNSTIFCLNFE